MAMNNSFYGGRRGASFVIVKNYSDIPSMTNDFKNGNSFKDVAFDEYVLINNPNKNHPDNGKIFRRGYDYNSNRKIEAHSNASGPAVEIEAHGAEYIGTIIGPAGKAPLLTMGAYDEVKELADSAFDERRSKGHYSPIEDTQRIQQEQEDTNTWREGPELDNDTISLVPGKYENNGQIKYNDSIEWCCVSIRNDDKYDDTQAYIGFKFPFLVTQMQTSQVEPYNTNGNIDDMSSISRVLNENETVNTHPYYNKWHLNIPKGVKGDTFKNLKVTTFNAYFNNSISDSNSHNRNLYDINDKVLLGEEDGEIKDNLTFFANKYEEIIGEILVLSNDEYDYITGKDRNDLLDFLLDKKILVYEKWNYDDKQVGQVTYYYLGDYNQIENVQFENGKLTFYFTHEDNNEFILDYIKDIKIEDETDSNPGKITLVHSTIDDSTHQPKETVLIDELKYIKDVELDTGTWVEPENTVEGENRKSWVPNDEAEGLLTIKFNTGLTKEWYIPAVNAIQYTETGQLEYRVFHSDESYPITKIKFIKKIHQDEESGTIFIIYNTIRDSQSVVDLSVLQSAAARNEAMDQIGDNEYDIFPIKAIVDIFYENGSIKAKYTTGGQDGQSNIKNIIDNFIDITKFEYDDEHATLNIKKNNVEESHELKLPTDISYNYEQDILEYSITNSSQKKQIGSLPLIKNMQLSQDKDFYIQMNKTGQQNNFITTDYGNDSSHPSSQGWVNLGNLGHPLQILKPVTNFTYTDLRNLLPENSDLKNNFPTDSTKTKDKINFIADVLNYLYPQGTVTGLNLENNNYADLGVVTVAESTGELVDFYGYDYDKDRTVTTTVSVLDEQGEVTGQQQITTNYGHWYYLGQIRTGGITVTESTNVFPEGTNILLTKQKIFSITTFSVEISNPMKSIQGGKNYITTVVDPTVTSSSNLFITMGGQELRNVYDINTKKITIDNVAGDIVISKISS